MSDAGARALDSYTYADYANFPEDARCEIIGGCVVMMAAAPRIIHQQVIARTWDVLDKKLRGHTCMALIAPTDVFLDFMGDLKKCRNIVQPDVLVICDPEKVDERGILGAPDLVVEIVSPSSLTHDIYTKTSLYAKFGVPEYWIVFPGDRIITVNTLNNGVYTQKTYHHDEYADEPARITSTAVPGLTLDVAEVFADLM